MFSFTKATNLREYTFHSFMHSFIHSICNFTLFKTQKNKSKIVFASVNDRYWNVAVYFRAGVANLSDHFTELCKKNLKTAKKVFNFQKKPIA